MIFVAFKTEEEIRDALYYAKNEAYTTSNIKHLADANRAIKSLEKAIGHKDVPCGVRTFYQWLQDSEDLQHKYARAIDERGLFLFEETMQIADNDDDCKYFCERSQAYKYDNGAIQNKRVKIDTRKWFLSKLLPQKYGERLMIDNTHTDKSQERQNILSGCSPAALEQIKRIIQYGEILSIESGTEVYQTKLLE